MAGKVSSDPNMFLLPDIGEGLAEAELIKWLVKPGDTINATDSLAEVETDKALTEVTSPRSGTIKTLHGEEGTMRKVGAPFVEFVDDGSAQANPDAASNGTAPAPEQEDAGTVVGAMSDDTPGMTRAEGKALATPAVRRLARDAGVNIDQVPGSGIGGRVTKKDIEAFAASGGTGGGVVAPSVGGAGGTGVPPVSVRRPLPPQPMHQQPMGMPQQAMPQAMPGMPMQAMPGMPNMMPGAPMPGMQGMPMAYMPIYIPVPMPQGGGGGVPYAPGFVPSAGMMPVPDPAQQAQPDAHIAFRGVRRTIAERLRSSVDTAVHFTVMDECDVTSIDELRKQITAQTGQKLSFLPFVAAAVCRALSSERGGRFGALNATVDEQAQEIIQHGSVHLGVATDTDSGLMVPVIRDAQRLDAVSLGQQIAATATSARDRSIPRDRLMGSTFTISNVGSRAGRYATPVINVPEVAILAVGKAYDGVVVRDGQAVVAKVLPLSLACDHRVVDGATAALALAEIIQLLSNPQQLLS